MISMTWPQYERKDCSFRGQVIRLTTTECEIVSTLLMRRGQAVPYEDIIGALWPNPDLEPDYAYNIIMQYRRKLTRKLPGVIECRHSVGLLIP